MNPTVSLGKVSEIIEKGEKSQPLLSHQPQAAMFQSEDLLDGTSNSLTLSQEVTHCH